MRDFIETLKGEGRTIFICTHNLPEAEHLCDRIAIFNQQVLAVDTPDALRQRVFGRHTAVRLRNPAPPLTQAVRELDFVKQVEMSDGEMRIQLDDPESQNPHIVRRLVEVGAEVQSVVELKHSLEDVYFSLVNDRADDGRSA